MEPMKNDEIDYIDIPAFIRRLRRNIRKYIVFVVPLIICMALCLALLSKPYARKDYIAGGNAMVGVRLSDSLAFDYNLSGLTWDRQSTLEHMNYVLNALTESGYIYQYVKDYMGIKRTEEMNGDIHIDIAYSTNLVNIYVVSDSQKDAEAIRDAVFTCLPDAVFPAVGAIELDVQEMYSREESSVRAFLASYKVWAAGGIVLGIIGYLGLIFLYTLRRKDVETPRDVSKLTDLPCLGMLPALKKQTRSRKDSDPEEPDKEYQRAFDDFRRNVADEIRQHQIRVLLLTGCGHGKGQSDIAAGLEKDWSRMGKKVAVTDLASIEGPMTEEKVRSYLDQDLEKADLVLIDGPSCDQAADTLILADCADAMLAVIREGASRPDEIKEMFQSLQYANAKPLGYVLNICSNI